MSVSGEEGKRKLRPNFNRSIRVDFQGAELSSDTGFWLPREMDERFLLSMAEGKLARQSF